MSIRVLVATVSLISCLRPDARAERTHPASSRGYRSASYAEHLPPGPWGRLEAERFTLTPPETMLASLRIDPAPPRWRIPGMDRKAFARLLAAAGEPDSAAAKWITMRNSREFPEGLGLSPSCAMVRALGAAGRAALYAQLEKDSANAGDQWRFPARYVAALPGFAEALSAFVVRDGAFLTTYCVSCVFGKGSSASSRNAFLGAISQQTSREVTLRVGARDDVGSLADYWSAGRGNGARRELMARLEAAARDPRRDGIPLASLLPPLPSSLLNGYRLPSAYADGPAPSRNCAWTALNFFRVRPEPRFEDAASAAGALTRDFIPVLHPRFGDVAVFLTPDEMMLHLATYVAGDLYFTKNGGNPLHPWVLNTLGELRESFSYGLPSGNALIVRYYRAREAGKG